MCLICLEILQNYILVKELLKEAGFDVDFADSMIEEGEKVNFWTSLKVVLSNKYMWIMGLAYFSTGVVRNGLEQ